MYNVTLSVDFPAKNQTEATNFALDLIGSILENEHIQSATLKKLEDHIDVEPPILNLNRSFDGYNNYPGQPL